MNEEIKIIVAQPEVVKTKVFVYGSLLAGFGNHGLLKEATFLGEDETPEGFGIVSLGGFPGALHVDGNKKVIGEVYEVNEDNFKRLDRLEGYNSERPTNGFYNRELINTKFGEAYIYTINGEYRSKTNPIIDSGSWREYVDNKKLTYII